MGDAMLESVYRLTREGQARFLGPTEQGSSTPVPFQPKHDKISHNISSQIPGSKRVSGSYANPSGKGEHALKTVGTSVDQASKGNQLRLPRPQGIETKLPAEDSRIDEELNDGFKQARLQIIQETKVETNTQLVPVDATRPSQLQRQSIQGNGIPIPDSKTKRWWIAEELRHPLLTVLELGDRKQGVIGNLKEAVDNHKILQHCTQFIDYKACMVGPSPNTSWPSILLFCREKDQKRLKKLLDPELLFEINCRSPYHSKRLPRPSVPVNPTFWIYIFPSTTNPTERFAGPPPVVVSLKTSPALSLCGALVEYQGRIATIGLAVEVDGTARLLTVDHIFNEDAPEEHPEEQGDDDDSSWDYDSGDEDDEMFSAAHYDLSQNDARISPASGSHEEDAGVASKSCADSPAHDPDDKNIHLSNAEGKHTDQTFKASTRLTGASTDPQIFAHRVHNQNQLSRRRAYLDWACLELDVDTPEKLLKTCISTDPNKVPILLEEVEYFPISHATSVLMISGINGTRPGKLLPQPTYLGSLPGQEMCLVWTLVLDSPQGLVPGECGAIVVDKDTHKVYGHVIGSNVLGHAHVVPLREVLDQMKIAFGTDLVHFPHRSSPPASAQSLNSDESLDSSGMFSSSDYPNANGDRKDVSIQASSSLDKPHDQPSLESPKNQKARLSSRITRGNIHRMSGGTDRIDRKFRDGYPKASRSKSTLATSTQSAASGPALSNFPDSTDDFIFKHASESRKRREYAMQHPGVTYPQTTSRPVAYAMQLNIDGSDDESNGGGSKHGNYSHKDHNDSGQTSPSYYGNSSSAYQPHSSGGQQTSY